MVAVITGGTRGIGLGVVKALLENGYTVVASSRSEGDEIKVLKEKYSEKLQFVACDISSEADIKNLASAVKEKYKSIDLLVNNAGVAPKQRKDILEVTPDEFSEVVNTNLKGTFFVTQSLAPLLIENKGGRIVNISSVSSYTASLNRGEYCISKAGISMTTKLFAARLAEYGISVLEIRPGIVETDMTKAVKEKYENMIDEGLTPIKRMGQPSDVAKCVLSIANGNFDFCTGTVIDCDGGFNVRVL